jgi:FkbM family methyltransferase
MISRIIGVIILCRNWPQIFLSKLFGYKITGSKLRNGTQFVVEKTLGAAELSMLTDIWQDHVYDPGFVTLAPQDIVVDVGANKGYFGVYASQTAKKVYAIEPHRETFARLKENIQLNHKDNIQAFNLGFWDKSGTVPFYLSSNSGGHSMRPKFNTVGEATADVLTLEEFCAREQIEKIDFLKLDCEGAEYNILLNLSSAMLSRIQKIAMEIHDFGQFNHNQIATFLGDHSFKVKIQQGYLYALKI